MATRLEPDEIARRAEARVRELEAAIVTHWKHTRTAWGTSPEECVRRFLEQQRYRARKQEGQ